MENYQPDLAGSILERISTDRAVREAFQGLLNEMQDFRAEVHELARALADPKLRRYLTTPEVAKMFGVSEATVRKRVNDGTWPAWRDGRQIRFGPEDIETIRDLGRPASVPLTPAERRTRNGRMRETARSWSGFPVETF